MPDGAGYAHTNSKVRDATGTGGTLYADVHSLVQKLLWYMQGRVYRADHATSPVRQVALAP